MILVTAERDATLRRQAAERGWGFLAKPVRAPALRALVSQTLLRLKIKAYRPTKENCDRAGGLYQRW